MSNFKSVLTKDSLSQKGVATLMVVSILTIVFVAISIAIARTTLTGFKSLENLRWSRKSYYLAESGIEDTILQVEENYSYLGNSSGETTPIGTYYSDVVRVSNNYDITVWVSEGGTERVVNQNLTFLFEVAEVTTKATYMADFFWISGEGARIRGDVWTNDDFEVLEHGVVEGNLASAGKGSFAVNWVWDGVMGGNPSLTGGEVLDNPETTDIIEGNIIAADAVKVSGPTAYVQGDVTSDGYVWELFGGTIDGTITEYAGQAWNQIPVPNFEFEQYEQEAVTDGTYFSNSNSFENYVDSLDDGNERRLPGDVYYVKNGAVKIEVGSPVYLDGLLVVEDNLYIYSEWYQNAQGGLPAIVTGKSLQIGNKFNFSSWSYDYSGPVRINGIVYSQKDVELFRTYSNEDIIVDGAVWAGDDIFVKEHSYIHYNIDPLNIVGFDFVTGITDLEEHYWQEIID
ncbi:hypothetical protein JW766_00855 [Candidatus Dojkabacteria bacterium]|nr:hypothetical protein [Candidatus Dojkabacteria bacterium]